MDFYFQSIAVYVSRRNVRRIITVLLIYSAVTIAISANNIHKFDSLVNKVSQMQSMHQAKTKLLIAQLYSMSHGNPDSLKLLPQCIYWEASTNYVQSCNDSVLLSKINSTLNMLSAEHHPYEWALGHLALGLHYTMQGDYAEAFVASLQALEYFSSLNDSLFIARTLISLGNTCYYIHSFEMAEDYFTQASLFVHPPQIDYYQIETGKARIYFTQQQFDSTISSLSEMTKSAKQQCDTVRLATIYLNLAACYQWKNEPDTAFQYYEKVLDWVKCIDNSRFKFTFYQNMATYYAAYTNDLQKPVYYYHLAKNMATNNNNLDQLSYLYYGLAKTFERFNCTDSAYFYLNLNNDLKDRLASNSKTIESYRAYISAVLETSDKELQIARQAVVIRNRQFWFVIFLFISIALVMVLLLIIMRQKRSAMTVQIEQGKEMHRAMTVQLEQDREIQSLQEEKITLQVRELTSHAMHLAHKDDILQQISDRIKMLPVNNEVKEIQQILKNNLSTDQSWESFMLHFSKVHPDFFERLKARATGLTENNLRICAYFRVGLSTKEIAQILNTTVGAVKRSRNRLKNKIGLGEDNSLDDFLRGV
ncbi:MAG: tetratricopeptide repeat protein [Cytophagaceae bacterium]|jgi:tetratricopeptide (TPR) repeat protein/DNA-binding CsgD family transcriptional regulator|nr:tetratricopeptide repeat protein [Cytophagaceae bacterium]